ncbi:succinylglutamate desuccinylase [Herminiimonas sp. CN]|uniref:succinylglutamate desuccinylase n=1 Tax=Herminiimonas sp. CN TaxID=1349818 RepID=UPI00047356C2|nr:succinylglutamate desuccinylase [Herminiimonas sp. CN]
MQKDLPAASMPAIPDPVRALAAADFTGIEQAFTAAGFAVGRPGPGMLQIASPIPQPGRMAVLLSVGIHGDETGPIEMLASLMSELAAAPQQLAVDLLLVVGNPGAIAQQRRFIEADLNRLFAAGRGALRAVAEAARADAIMGATAGFFARTDAPKWHLDLHTAIRPSRYPTFAIVPDVIADAGKRVLHHWLAHAGIEAEVVSPHSAGTYSAYSAQQCAAISATLELGQVGRLGQNDASLLAQPQAALAALLRAQQQVLAASDTVRLPQRFRVTQEIIKRSDAFRMACDRNTCNFTPMQQGQLIASDGATEYRVRQAQEYILFPNPEVRVGLRAGLMAVHQQ